MDNPPFSLEEANDICEDFEDLIDTDFKVETLVFEIDNVMVCPYPDADKQQFVANYRNTKDKKESLNFYSGDEFDVIVFAHNIADAASYQYIDIRTFAVQMGISYRYPGPE